jgi:hypothetical protein
MEGDRRGLGGTSGRRLALAIVSIGVVAGVAALFFREFTPRTVPPAQPATQPAASQPG